MPSDLLGWLFTIERSTLLHTSVFHVLARQHPGEMAFAASYLKCYFGAVGEAWLRFGALLDTVTVTDEDVTRLISAARAAFEVYQRARGVYAVAS